MHFEYQRGAYQSPIVEQSDDTSTRIIVRALCFRKAETTVN